MIIFLSLLLCVSLVALVALLVRTRRVVGELQDAVRLNRCMLLNVPSAVLKRLGFEGLIKETNHLIDRYRG